MDKKASASEKDVREIKRKSRKQCLTRYEGLGLAETTEQRFQFRQLAFHPGDARIKLKRLHPAIDDC